MRIINQKFKKAKEFKKTCWECKTKFSYVSTDIKTDRDGHYVNCPSCKAFVAI